MAEDGAFPCGPPQGRDHDWRSLHGQRKTEWQMAATVRDSNFSSAADAQAKLELAAASPAIGRPAAAGGADETGGAAASAAAPTAASSGTEEEYDQRDPGSESGSEEEGGPESGDPFALAAYFKGVASNFQQMASVED